MQSIQIDRLGNFFQFSYRNSLTVKKIEPDLSDVFATILTEQLGGFELGSLGRELTERLDVHQIEQLS